MTLANNTTRVKDMKQYMLAVLYNAPTTISSYYQNWVQHDMAKDYAFWMFIAALFNLPAQSLNCAARAESSVKISSIAVTVGAALNVALYPVFMFS
ncbi:MAG: DUF6017 domain-containing protein, partial [Oscillospiraceae bacterium]|nr:DUF6017 domain-containing protein [Oscillospiraceae bacterium]